MGMWAGIYQGMKDVEERKEREEERELRLRQADRLDEEFRENKLLRRSKSVLDYLDGRGKKLGVNTASLSVIKSRLGNVPGSNEFLAKISANPTALDAVYTAIINREDATGEQITGQELLDNVQILAENYNDETWMSAYNEARDIYDIATRLGDELLDDGTFGSLMGRVGDLPDVVTPSVGVSITPGFTAKLTPTAIKEQVNQFDEAILAYANDYITSQSIPEGSDVYNYIENYSDDPTKLRKMFGPIVLHQLQQFGGTLFQPGLAPNLAPYAINPDHIEALKEKRDDPAAKEAFDQQYGPGAADFILGM